MNEKKFLAELSKLLTFMYEEDRQMALSMYEKMFSFAEDETALLHFLGSPTKQAVLIARSYNAKERKLAVTSQTGADDADVASGETPPFVLAITGIHNEAEDLDLISSEVMQDQISIFNEEFPEEETLFTPEKAAQEPQPAAAPPVNNDSLSEFTLKMPDEVTSFVSSGENQKADLRTPSLETGSSSGPADAEVTSEKTQGENLMLDLGPVPEAERSDSIEIDATMAAFRDRKEVPRKGTPAPASVQTTLSEFDDLSTEQALPWKKELLPETKPVSKPIIPLIILYLIIAVPITAACVLVLLVPALLFLFFAVAAGITAFHVITLAFGHFAVFADIMVVLGAALVLFALALLFLWIFLWFIGSAIACLINGAIRLGGKICYREEKEA